MLLFRPLEVSWSNDGIDIDERAGLRRIEVLSDVRAGRRTVAAVAAVLAVSERQAYRLVARCRDGGGGALIHKSRGRPASNKLGQGVRELVLELVRQNYRDFGPTLAAEVLLERDGVEVSRETVRKWSVSGWSRPASGCHANSAGASISQGSDARATAS